MYRRASLWREVRVDKDKELQDWQATSEEFFAGRTLEELAVTQGVEPLLHIGDLAGGLPDDEDVDEMLWIYRRRR